MVAGSDDASLHQDAFEAKKILMGVNVARCMEVRSLKIDSSNRRFKRSTIEHNRLN